MKNQPDWMRQILTDLYRLANPVDAEGAKRFFTTRMRVLGIRAPVLQQMERDQRERMAAAPGEDVVALAKGLAESNIFEARQLAYLMLGNQKGALACLTLADLEELGDGMDNWASVDTFSTLLAGALWKNGQITDQDVHSWAAGGDVWWRRTALVSTIPLNLKSKGGRGDPVRTLDVCNRLKGDPHRMVQKAVSWALRELLKRHPDEVHQFLVENQSEMTKSTFSEVSKRLEESRKKEKPGI